MAVIGNSFAHSSFFAVVESFAEDIKEIRLLSNSVCHPFFNLTESYSEEYRNVCLHYLDKTVAVVEEMKPDLIFLIFL